MTLVDWVLVAWAGTMVVAVGVVCWRVVRRSDQAADPPERD
jgi:hypothetical protein